MGSNVEIMVDIETLGTAPGAVILSIGAAASDGRTFYRKIYIADSLYRGFEVNADTLAWWRKQSREAWESTTDPAESFTVIDTLHYFSIWVTMYSEDVTVRLWGDSAGFDLGLIAEACRRVGHPVPWKYQQEHCYRTLRQILKSPKPAAELAHNALSDAKAQLSHLLDLLPRVPGMNP